MSTAVSSKYGLMHKEVYLVFVEEHTLSVSENRRRGEYLYLREEKVAGGWRKMHSEEPRVPITSYRRLSRPQSWSRRGGKQKNS